MTEGVIHSFEIRGNNSLFLETKVTISICVKNLGIILVFRLSYTIAKQCLNYKNNIHMKNLFTNKIRKKKFNQQDKIILIIR
jgi:hypothetical protein